MFGLGVGSVSAAYPPAPLPSGYNSCADHPFGDRVTISANCSATTSGIWAGSYQCSAKCGKVSHSIVHCKTNPNQNAHPSSTDEVYC